MPLRRQPLRPGVAAAAAHQRRLDPGLRRLEPRVVDAVVADHRRREGDELAREARVGDRLLVAGHRGREDGLAEGDAGGADRAGREDGAVLEGEIAVAHAAYTTRPSAIVLTTVPVSVSPSSHELTDFDAKPSSVTVPGRVEIEQDEVRALAHLDPRHRQPEDPGRAGGHPLEHEAEVELARLDEERVERRERRLEAR